MITIKNIKDPDLMWKVEQNVREQFAGSSEEVIETMIEIFEKTYTTYGEYINIAIDPVTGKAKVLPINQAL